MTIKIADKIVNHKSNEIIKNLTTLNYTFAKFNFQSISHFKNI